MSETESSRLDNIGSEQPNQEIPEEVQLIDGQPYRRVDTGYTVRQWFSHSTREKGPGPGWDTRFEELRKLGIDPHTNYYDELPDTPYYQYELVKDNKL